MRRVRVSSAGRQLCTSEVADTIASRARGLLGRRSLPEGQGLLIEPCNSVHTWFMSFSIDVIYLSQDDSVLKVATRLKPYRFSWGGRQAKRVLELAAGAVPEEVVPGVQLQIEEIFSEC
jgi:hypothetical protein